MRHVAFAILLVLGLPQMATAAAIEMRAEPVLADGTLLERATAPAAPARGPDLRMDDGTPRVVPESPDGAQPTEFPWRKGEVATEEPRDRGLSFGLEIKPRSRFGDLARKDDAENPSLGDQLDKLIERPVFGLRGRYRF